jgi:DNA invertase Pin-like site-specific DNA recombinase
MHARVSTHDQQTLGLQFEAMRAYLKDHGWVLARQVKDVGSGAKERPGRAMAGLLAVFAEFEREILRERVRAGIAQARKEGRRHGRPRTAAPRPPRHACRPR